jgi:hypothetical protein
MAKVVKEPTTGKLGLTVFYPGRNGLIQRAWVAPANPKTGDQLLVRSHLTTVTRAWKGLEEAQRQAWIAAAATINSNPTLGMSGKLTGAQLFTKINCALLAIGGDMVDTPPAAPEDDSLPVTGLEITNTGGTVAIKVLSASAPPDGTMLRASAPQSAGTYRPISLRLLGTLGSPSAGKIDITAQYTAKYGVPAVGTKLFVRINSNISGWEGTPVMFTGIVPAST